MVTIDYKASPTLFADLYSKLQNMNGTQYLAFRDLPKLLNNYVTGSKTLDYGCGTGRSSRLLKSLDLNVEGVDINPDMIRYAESYDKEGEYQVIQSAKILREDNRYDLVFACWVLMTISSKKELIDISKEINRVLKDNGTFIAVVFNEHTYSNKDWLSHNTQYKENEALTSGAIVKLLIKDINLEIFDYFWSEDDYREVIAAANFELIEIHYPLGKQGEGYKWVNEDNYPICSIYIAKKGALLHESGFGAKQVFGQTKKQWK